jgi:4a-hydroxytetrahydrobiopterin dehydratase
LGATQPWVLRKHDAMSNLSGQQVADEALAGWVNLVGGLQTRIPTGSFATGLTVVNAIGAAAEEMDHHPDLDLRYGHLDVRLSSHDTHGITKRDIRLARRISTIAADAGLHLEAGSLSRLELALDAPAFEKVLPFWAAVLGLDAVVPEAGDELRDPSGVLPTVWFQRSGRETDRQRWHPDVWLDPDAVQARIDAALAAGGSLVSDEEAPSFWVLADSDGNRVCLCTWQDRD